MTVIKNKTYLLTLFMFLSNLISIETFKASQFHQAETMLTEVMEKYVNDFENKITKLKGHLDEYEKLHKYAEKDVTKYLSNPINSYLLTKRLTSDWPHLETVISSGIGLQSYQNITLESLKGTFPNEKKLKNVIQNLVTLQQKYFLSVEEIASGIFEGIKYSDPLTSDDCFEIGQSLVRDENNRLARLWLEESLKRYNEAIINSKQPIVTKEYILDFLSFTNSMLGNLEQALAQSKEAFEINPSLEHVYKNIESLQMKIASKAKTNTKSCTILSSTDWNKKVENRTDDELDLLGFYEDACQGNVQRSATYEKHLHCKYFSRKEYFILAPVKVEIVNYDPMIFILHDMIRDNEIEILKINAEMRLSPKTNSDNPYENVRNNIKRDSKIAFLKNEENHVLLKLDQRLEHITDLDLRSSENLQIVKYETGGFYTPHHDFIYFDETNTKEFKNGSNRIATILLYLSDVEKGGTTVFPFLDLRIHPEKGNAVFWYNYHASGNPDFRTLHAACPVVSGSKWVANKWILEKNQEFRRPCSINRDDESY